MALRYSPAVRAGSASRRTAVCATVPLFVVARSLPDPVGDIVRGGFVCYTLQVCKMYSFLPLVDVAAFPKNIHSYCRGCISLHTKAYSFLFRESHL